MSSASIESKDKSISNGAAAGMDSEGGVKAYQSSLTSDEAELLRFGYKQGEHQNTPWLILSCVLMLCWLVCAEFKREFRNLDVSCYLLTG